MNRNDIGDDTAWQSRAGAIIDDCISRGQTITYAELAGRAGVPGPGRIHALTLWLEETMERDAENHRAMRARVVVSRTNGRPARGFYEKLAALGIDAGGLDPDDKAQD